MHYVVAKPSEAIPPIRKITNSIKWPKITQNGQKLPIMSLAIIRINIFLWLTEELKLTSIRTNILFPPFTYCDIIFLVIPRKMNMMTQFESMPRMGTEFCLMQFFIYDWTKPFRREPIEIKKNGQRWDIVPTVGGSSGRLWWISVCNTGKILALVIVGQGYFGGTTLWRRNLGR